MKAYLILVLLLLTFSVGFTQNNAGFSDVQSHQQLDRDSDTCIIIRPGFRAGKDAIVHGLESERSVNYGLIGQLTACSWTFSGDPGDIRGLVEFNLDLIPPGSEISHASLSLFAWGEDYGLGQHSMLSGSNAAWIQRITTSWNELEVTWLTQPSTTTENQVSVFETDIPDLDYLDIDVTNLVIDMLANPDESFGFMIRMKLEEYYRRLNFCTSDHEDPSKHPMLEVCYTPPTDLGVEEEVEMNAITLFPNPVSKHHIITIKGIASEKSDVHITVYDMQGNLVPITWEKTTNDILLKTESLTVGSYLIRVSTGKRVMVKKMLVHH